MKEKLIGKKYLPHRTVIGFVLGIETIPYFV